MTVKLQKHLIDFEGSMTMLIQSITQIMSDALSVSYVSPKEVFAHVRPTVSHKLYGLS